MPMNTELFGVRLDVHVGNVTAPAVATALSANPAALLSFASTFPPLLNSKMNP